MWVLNVSRAHPFDVAVRLVLPYMLLIILGIDKETIGLYLVLSGVVAFLQHSNLRLNTRLLSYVFVTPALHHWHHSKTSRCNYGHVLSVYDLMFGTFYLPKDKNIEREEVGIHGEVPKDFIGQMKHPFL